MVMGWIRPVLAIALQKDCMDMHMGSYARENG